MAAQNANTETPPSPNSILVFSSIDSPPISTKTPVTEDDLDMLQRFAEKSLTPQFCDKSIFTKRMRYVSDIHIGSTWFSNEKNLQPLLDMLFNTASSPDIEDLIFLGDVIELWQGSMDKPMEPLNKRMQHDMVLIAFVNAVVQVHNAGKRIWWVNGNHDGSLTQEDLRMLFAGTPYTPDLLVTTPTGVLGDNMIVHAEHGHFDDLFNSDDPAGRGKPLGYYVTRLDCTKPIKDSMGATCGTQLIRNTPNDAWDMVDDLVNLPIVSRVVVKNMMKRKGIKSSRQFVENEPEIGLTIKQVVQKYQRLLCDWNDMGCNVANMLKASAGDHSARIASLVRREDMPPNIVIMGHTHDPKIEMQTVVLDEEARFDILHKIFPRVGEEDKKDDDKEETRDVCYANTGSWIYEGKRQYSTFIDLYWDDMDYASSQAAKQRKMAEIMRNKVQAESPYSSRVAVTLNRWDEQAQQAVVIDEKVLCSHD